MLFSMIVSSLGLFNLEQAKEKWGNGPCSPPPSPRHLLENIRFQTVETVEMGIRLTHQTTTGCGFAFVSLCHRLTHLESRNWRTPAVQSFLLLSGLLCILLSYHPP